MTDVDTNVGIDSNDLEIMINTRPNELYDIKTGEFDITEQFDTIISIIDEASVRVWVNAKGKEEGAPFLDYEVKAQLLERLVLSLFDDLNQVVQFVGKDRLSSTFSPPSEYITIVNASPVWKVFCEYFFGIDYFKTTIPKPYTSSLEIDRLSDIYEYLPPGMQDAVVAYCERAAAMQYGPPIVQ